MKDPEKRFGSAAAMKKALEYLTAYPATVFREHNAVTADGRPIISTGAPTNNGNNTVITNEISPLEADEEIAENAPVQEAPEENPDEEEDEFDYVKPSSPSMLPIVLGVTLAFFTVLAVTGIIAAKTFLSPDTEAVDDTVEVPQLVNEEFNKELHDSLTAKGFKVTVKTVFNESVEAGHIVHQTPLAGSTRKPNKNGIPLELEVSQGTSETVLKDYAHYGYANVKLQLEKMKLKVSVKEEFHDTVVIDHIIRTEPEAGSVLFEGDTVTLYVSKGPDDLLVEIPMGIIGQKYEKAESILQNLGIKLAAERGYEFSDAPEGTVIRTEPAVGTTVSVNTDTVKVIVSNGSDPQSAAVQTGTGGSGSAGFQQVGSEVIVGTQDPVAAAPAETPAPADSPEPVQPESQEAPPAQEAPEPSVPEPPKEVAPGDVAVHGKTDENSSEMGNIPVNLPYNG